MEVQATRIASCAAALSSRTESITSFRPMCPSGGASTFRLVQELIAAATQLVHCYRNTKIKLTTLHNLTALGMLSLLNVGVAYIHIYLYKN